MGINSLFKIVNWLGYGIWKVIVIFLWGKYVVFCFRFLVVLFREYLEFKYICVYLYIVDEYICMKVLKIF